MIIFPLIVSIYVGTSTIDWGDILVSPDELGVTISKVFLIVYSLFLFAVSCFVLRRILFIQRVSLNEFEKEVEKLSVKHSYIFGKYDRSSDT